MEANEFIDLLKNPAKVEGKTVEELKKLAADFPYSQSVQLLYTIRLSQSSEYLFNRQLGKTSLLTDDRSVLFDLFEREPDEPKEALEPSGQDSRAFEISETQKPEPEIAHSTAHPEPFPEDNVKDKEVQKEEGTKEPWPASKAGQSPVPEASQKLDLSGLSPSEKVKAILAENRRLREEFADKKDKGETETVAAKPVETEEPAIAAETVEKELSEVFEPTKAESIESTPEPAAEPGAEAESEPSSDIAEASVFTIEEEKAETVFSIEEEDEKGESFEKEAADGPAAETHEKETPGDDGKSHSFSQWLHRLKAKEAPETEESNEEPPAKSELEEKLNLVDTFVEKLPELKKKSRLQKPLEAKPSVNMNRLMEDSEEGSMVTETLARVYVRQKHYDKAIKAYEIMKLKYPEKSSFFADRILEIKKLINSK